MAKRLFYPNIMNDIQRNQNRGLPVGMTLHDEQRFLALPRSVRKRFQDLMDTARTAGLHPNELKAFCDYVLNYAALKTDGVTEIDIPDPSMPQPATEAGAEVPA